MGHEEQVGTGRRGDDRDGNTGGLLLEQHVGHGFRDYRVADLDERRALVAVIVRRIEQLDVVGRAGVG
jgi:hypothetical protein